MDRSKRTALSALLAVALAVASPVAASADDGTTVNATPGETSVSAGTSATTTAVDPVNVGGTSTSATVSSTGTISLNETTVTATTSSGSVSTDGTTTTLSAPTVTVTTTGTTATASVPTTTVTVGGVSGGSSPDLSTPSTGSGSATATQSVTRSGTGLVSGQDVSTSLTDPSSPATLMASDGTVLDEGAAASVGASEPVTGTTLSGAAGAHALICLLAEASVDPTRAALSSLCGGGPSTVDGNGGIDAANAPTGATISTDAALRAAICLLAVVASPLPGDIDTAELASASLSTLCGAGPSIVNGGGDLTATSDRTGTDVDVAPVVAAATCILVNGTVGDPTVAHLSSLCAPASGDGGSPTPSTVGASAPTTFSDATTDTGADLAPAASAAICILVDALAQVPENSEPAAAASLSTACSTSGGTTPTPSTIETSTPATVSTPGPDTDVAPAVKAAVCILASAQAGTGGADANVTDGCPTPTITTSLPDGTPTAPGGMTTAPDGGVEPAVAGVITAPVGPGQAGTMPEGTGGTAPAAQAGFTEPTNLMGLPATATAAGGIGLFIATVMALAALGKRRRR